MLCVFSFILCGASTTAQVKPGKVDVHINMVRYYCMYINYASTGMV